MMHCLQEGMGQAWESLKERAYLIPLGKVVFASLKTLILMKLGLPLQFLMLQ